PETISYVEAHGTGTKLGDPIEITALTQAFGKGERPFAPTKNYCAVGSVKTNVGHLQMASGIVGLIKTTLCLYHQKIPPSLHFKQPNPQIDFEHSPFYINNQLQNWQTDNYPRRAGVNSLGIGGTNAHLILEEFVTAKVENNSQLPAYLLTLSAKNEAALVELSEKYQDYIVKHPEINLADICLTSNLGRHHFEYRQAIVASNKLELIEKLKSISNPHIVQQNNKIAWLFTGQGSQYVGMAQELYKTAPLFRDNIDQCAEILNNQTVGAFRETPLQELNFDINQTEYTQPLLFAIAYSLAQLWLSWGIKPDVVMGHSVGEYVAACIAGVFSLEDGLKLVATRGQLMQSLPKNGAMLAVFCPQEKINNLLNQDVTIAADNGSHVVLSGIKDAIKKIAKELDLLGIKNQYLKVSHAFHSELMQPIIEEFKAVAETINYQIPQIPIISNLTGELSTKDIATSDYWINHICQPVQFAKSIRFLDKQEISIFLEIGVKPTLTVMAQNILNDKIFLSSLNPKKNDWRQILESLKEIYFQGIEINWAEVTKNYNGHKISLPTYPFQRQRYWFDIPVTKSQSNIIKKRDSLTITSRTPFTIDEDIRSDRGKISLTAHQTQDELHPLLGKPLNSPLKQIIFQSHLQPETLHWLQEHCLEDRPVFPGAGYLEIAIASGIFHLKTNQLTIENVTIQQLLHLSSEQEQTLELQTILNPEKAFVTWETYSSNNKQWQLHSSGQILPSVKTAEDINLELLKEKFINSELDVEQYYQQCQQRGINYGQSFQGIKKLWTNENKALGFIELPNNLINSHKYYLHPALLDSCLQILFVALPAELQRTTFIPIGLDKLHLYNLPDNKIWSYLKLNNNNEKSLTADVWLYSDRGELIAKLEGLKSQAIQSQPSWHNWLYQPQWQQQSLIPKSSISNKLSTWLIFADNTGVGKQLVTLLESQHQQCYVVSLPENNLINSHNIESFQFLLEQYSDIKGIIYLWSLDAREDGQECKNYLYLIQALVKQNLPNNPRLWFVTRNAQPVNNYRLTSGIRQSCLWGMGKAIALEYPELAPVGIDLDANFSGNEAEHILQEICSLQIEQVAYHNNQRYVSRLVKSSLNFSAELPENLQLQITNTGNLDNLQWNSVPRQEPQDNEIEIQVKATGLNFRDVMVALDLYPDNAKFLGLECAGIVTNVGKDVTNFKIGDEAIAIASHSFSEYLTVNSLLAIPKPQSLSFPQAATIPVTFLTAYYTLVHLAQLQPVEKVLIHSAAGGVGLAAIQIAQQIGAEIFATASPGKWELLKSMGIKNIMNSRNLDFADEIMSATQGQGVDVILNSLSGKFIPQNLSVLNDQGRFLEIGKQDIWLKSDINQIKPNINYFIVDLWQITQDKPELIQHMMSQLLPQFTRGKLKPLPNTVFERDRITEAFRYMQQGKHQGKIIISQKIPISPSPITFQGTYLITGGMGAIALQVAEWLTTKRVSNLVLVGRNDIKPELENNLNKLQNKTQVTIIQADVADEKQLAQVLEQIELTLPPLRGVVHCAGVLDDRVISKQDWASFNKVLAPKVQGAWNLHTLTQKYDLESFILFSSASSLLGSAGQVNYCAANAFLDALAHARRAQGLSAIAINWGAWENTGLAAEAHISDSLKQKGIGTINSQQGIEILEQLLLHAPTQIGVIPIDWNLWQTNNFVTPFYENLVTQQSIGKTSFKQQLSLTPSVQRRALLIEQLTQQVANILGIKDLNQIDLDLGFSELGLDSLSSVELRNQIQSTYDTKLPSTVIFDYSNIKVLADYLLSILFTEESTKETVTHENKNIDFAEFEDLSEVEAEALLLEELKDFKF
ncbi:MAG: type I polyketide synthase, partial [Cyanobacteria bacterium P01_F01_bin.143]